MGDWIKKGSDHIESEEDELKTDWKRLPTASIDVSSMLRELDESGSYYFQELQATSFGKLLECLPIGCFLLDEKGKIVFLNSYWESVTKNSNELLGELLSSLVIGETRVHEIENQIRNVYETRARVQGETVLNIMGSKSFGRFHIRSVRMKSSRYLLVLFLDLTSEKKQILIAQKRKKELYKAQELLKKRLEEKEVLLREIHHRVKNSLQLASSLLALQGEHAQDQKISAALKDAGDRIWSMALVHEALYRTNNLAEISASEYMSGLVEHLLWSGGAAVSGLNVDFHFEEVSLKADTAINCGLILNELLSNVLKHAFPKGSGGSVKLSLAKTSDKDLEFRVSDSGRGIPQGSELKDLSGYGLSIVRSLVSEMHGTIELNLEHGSEFIIRFRED